MSVPVRIVILGGGFGGTFTALELERLLKGRDDVEITLVNRENYLLFTPMLHEIAASDLDPTDIVNPIHKLLKRVRFFCGSVDRIDFESRSVVVSHGDTHHSHTLPFEHLVVALGGVTHFYGLPGLQERAITMKSLGDALYLRNRMIGLVEEADFECCKDERSKLLTFVVAGGGFAGVETVGAIDDFLKEILHFYPNLRSEELRIVLVHSGRTVLPELDDKLGRYAGRLLQKRGIEIVYGAKVCSFKDDIVLSNGTVIEAATLVWTAGTMPNPRLDDLKCHKEKGRLLVEETLNVSGYEGLWALGDSAAVPDGTNGRFHPPTAQHAVREAKTAARNIVATIDGKNLKPFKFKTLGQLASLGRRKGVAQVMGFRFSGFIAWWMWRTIYLMKLPRLEKRVRVALNWTLDVFFSKDMTQLPTFRGNDGGVGDDIRSIRTDEMSNPVPLVAPYR